MPEGFFGGAFGGDQDGPEPEPAKLRAFPMSTEPLSSKAIFISYASQDAAAARRIANALRQGGIEVWFDQSELRGGEAWGGSIRGPSKRCKLVMPIISARPQGREGGYLQ